jgi:formate dehydrogenase subunit gamma
MTRLRAYFRLIIGTLALAFVVAAAAPAGAQQPVNPTASAVQEEQLLNALRGGDAISGRITIPDRKAATLIQPEGRDWRQFHNGTLRWVGLIAIIGMLIALVAFYLWRGMVMIRSGRSGRVIVRFNAFERFIHWMTAACFIILAITGLNITFGRPLFASSFGSEAFTAWSQWAKYAHNYLSFPFTIGVIVIFLMWIAGNIPNRTDVEWMKQGGGMIDPDKHPAAYRFNAGQKMIYWIVVLGGAAMAITGYILMFPFSVTDMAGMQTTQMVHGIIAVLFVAAMLAHIYIGTMGMEGAFEAMGTGTVDENWAREHHSLWLEEERARTGPAQQQRQPMGQPAE